MSAHASARRRRATPLAWLRLSGCLLLLGLAPAVAHAQVSSAGLPELTAAFLINFVKFTEWPGDDGVGPITLCTNDAGVAKAAGDLIVKRPSGSRPVDIQRVALDPAPTRCAILYVSGMDNKRVALLSTALKGTSVLTVSDAADFARQGGVIHLFLQGDTMRFEINVSAATRANLRLSSKLLSLAVILRD